MAKIKWKVKEDIESEERQRKAAIDKREGYKVKLRDKTVKVEDKLEMLIELFLGQEK